MALRCSIGAVIAACGLIIPLTAQPSQQAFEVASVKRAAKPGRLTFPSSETACSTCRARQPNPGPFGAARRVT